MAVSLFNLVVMILAGTCRLSGRHFRDKLPNSRAAGVTSGAFMGTALLQRHRKENEGSGLQSAEVLDAISAQEPIGW